MSNELINPNLNFPAHLMDFGDLGMGINAGITGGIKAGGHPRIAIKGSKWRIEENGAEEIHPLHTLDVIIVDTNHFVSKVFYAGKYNPQATEFKAPDCFSDNGIAPSTQATAPQCGTCAICPHNAWGSKVNELGNKTKACADYKKVAVVLADDPERNVYELRIPGASLQDFNKTMARVVNNRLPIPAIVFQLSFDPDVDYPRIMFKAKGYVEADLVPGVRKWLGSAEAKEAVGASDQPISGAVTLSAPQPQAATNPYPQAGVAANTMPPPRPQALPDPMAALNEPGAETPKRRGRPAKAAEPVQAGTQGRQATPPTGQMTLDLPGVQAPAQSTPISPTKTSADLDALLAGIV